MTRMVLTLIGFSLLFGCEKEAKKEPEKIPEKPAIPVEAVKVAKSLVSRQVMASGVASGIKEAYVVSETAGKILQVRFNLGQKVGKGALLVKVESETQRNALESARKDEATSAMNLKVVKKLFKEGSASQAELNVAQSGAAGAKAQLESMEKALENCSITAPISGYIASKAITLQPGNLLAPGAVITRIVDIASLKATVAVGEMEVGLLSKNMDANIRAPAADSGVFTGKVTAIAAGSDPATGSYPVEVSWNNTRDRKIKAGMSVRVTIATQTPDSIILIPVASIVEKERKDAVFVESGSKAVVKFVTLGRVVGANREVLEGILPGEILLTSGMTALSRGDKIAVTVTN